MEKSTNLTNGTVCPEDWTQELEVPSSIAVLAAVVFFLIETVGTVLLWGIYHFEHFGGDPQKRGYGNMILSYEFQLYLFLNVTVQPVAIYRYYYFHFIFCVLSTIFFLFCRYIVGPVGNFWTSVYFFSKNWAALWSALLFTFLAIEKLFSMFNWKLVAGMNDQLLSFYTLILTGTFSFTFIFTFFELGGIHEITHAIFSGDCTTLSTSSYVEASEL